jgi:hypothetical protein
MTTFDPAEVRKAVAEFTPRRPQKFQVVEKSLAAVNNARIVPLRFTTRALVTSLHFQDSNKSAGLPSALTAGVALRLHLPRSPTTDRSQTIRIKRPGDELANQ